MLQFLQNNMMLVSLSVFSGAMLFWSFFGNRILGIKEVEVVQAVNLINRENALVLDVRQQNEYDNGHVGNSRLISLGELKKRIGELEKYRNRPVVVMCRSGARSASGASLLSKSGFTKVYSLSGGIVAWQKASMPIER